MGLTFYDYTGRPIAYTANNESIYLFSGIPVAYIYRDSIYAYSGKHLGWFIHGWIIDHSGGYVFFSEKSSGGPVKPLKHLRPVKSVKNVRPVKAGKQVKPNKPSISTHWSSLSGIDFFR